MDTAIINALTVDVEDYFQVSAFSENYPRDCWDTLELRVEKNTYRLLALFEQHQVKATFFTLGWVAQRCPQLVRDIVKQGHELACHGHWHRRVSELSPREFYDDLSLAKHLLEDISGRAVHGFRAPSFSINEQNVWAFEVIRDLGFKYSSSTYPIVHDHYGTPQWPRFPYQVVDSLIEIPITTWSVQQRNWPIAGGGYFRLYPYWFSRWLLQQYLQTEQAPGVFYIHPWEIDPTQPATNNISFKTKFRHYINLAKVEARLNRLLTDFNWSTMQDVYSGQLNNNLASIQRQELVCQGR